MANQEQLDMLKQGVEIWNEWREKNPDVQIDLSEANLTQANLSRANLGEADLHGADLSAARLRRAYLSGANLHDVDLSRADLSAARLRGALLRRAKLIETNLREANLTKADLREANLTSANLTRTVLLETNLSGATLTQCFIYGISVWNVQLEGAKQESLVITGEGEPNITVDHLEVAQFIYLLLNSEKVRNVINTSTTKAVLILGLFTPEHKTILDALREALRTHGYLPIVFNFYQLNRRDSTETLSTLARLARFIVADLTSLSSIPLELYAIVPTLAVPVQPVLLEGKKEDGKFVDFLKTYHWVLPIHYYTDQTNLLTTLKEHVIEPAEQKAKEFEKR
jgi:hypothetical protein